MTARFKHSLLITLLLSISSLVYAQKYQEIEWIDLLPKEDLEALQNPPAELANIADGSAADRIAQSIGQAMQPEKDTPYYRALVSTRIRPEYNKQKIKIAAFIVPLEFDDNQIVTEFFLVPYFGACIHVPPPPPNQIILARSKKGIKLESIYNPFWLTGTMSTEIVEHEIATAAYQMDIDGVSNYDIN